jgi:hypothetical protein
MIYGWDISTSVVGLCKLDNSGQYLKSEYCDLTKISGSLINKACLFFDFVQTVAIDAISYNEPMYIFIEDRLAGFSAGKTMQQTLMKLAAFNGMASWIIWSSFDDLHADVSVFEHIHPSTAKALMGLKVPKGGDKKKLTVDLVVSLEGSRFIVDRCRTGSIRNYVFDMADAYLIAKAGHKKFICK